MTSGSPPDSPPSLYQWAGGMPAIERLMDIFYRKVRADGLLAPLFAHMSDAHRMEATALKHLLGP